MARRGRLPRSITFDSVDHWSPSWRRPASPGRRATFNPDAQKASYADAALRGRSCGQLALAQIELGVIIANEQPAPSWLYAELPWPAVLGHEDADKRAFDGCKPSLRDRHGGMSQKTIGLVSNS